VAHFETEEWIDFARKLGSAEKRQSMQQHLGSGCATCKATLQFWEGITQSASREASYQPPDYLVRRAKGMGAIRQIRAFRSPFAILAELVMDSSRLPAAAGLRSTGQAPLLLLYRAGQVNIDIRFEEVPTSNRISVVGQVLDLSKPKQPVANVQVAIVCVDAEIGKAKTNQFGEFQMEYEAKSQVELIVRISDDKEIIVPLSQSMSKHPGGILY